MLFFVLVASVVVLMIVFVFRSFARSGRSRNYPMTSGDSSWVFASSGSDGGSGSDGCDSGASDGGGGGDCGGGDGGGGGGGGD